MNYGSKPIEDLTDDELWEAIHTVGGMDNFRFDKLKDPRINKPKHRLNKIFKTNPPTENKAFTELTIALNNELKNRTNNNANN